MQYLKKDTKKYLHLIYGMYYYIEFTAFFVSLGFVIKQNEHVDFLVIISQCYIQKKKIGNSE